MGKSSGLRESDASGANSLGIQGKDSTASRGAHNQNLLENDAGSVYTEESYYEGQKRRDQGSRDGDSGDADDVSSNMSKYDGGFAAALTDEEYFLVMGTIGIAAPEVDELDGPAIELTDDEAKRRIDSWFAASPERAAMGEK